MVWPTSVRQAGQRQQQPQASFIVDDEVIVIDLGGEADDDTPGVASSGSGAMPMLTDSPGMPSGAGVDGGGAGDGGEEDLDLVSLLHPSQSPGQSPPAAACWSAMDTPRSHATPNIPNTPTSQQPVAAPFTEEQSLSVSPLCEIGTGPADGGTVNVNAYGNGADRLPGPDRHTPSAPTTRGLNRHQSSPMPIDWTLLNSPPAAASSSSRNPLQTIHDGSLEDVPEVPERIAAESESGGVAMEDPYGFAFCGASSGGGMASAASASAASPMEYEQEDGDGEDENLDATTMMPAAACDNSDYGEFGDADAESAPEPEQVEQDPPETSPVSLIPLRCNTKHKRKLRDCREHQ